MKKILLLGGSYQQIVAIEKSKKLGYHTILCDYLPDNPGRYHSDEFYQVSTTDKDSVLEIAQQEKIDGILAYASDPAAPTAAYVAERLKLPSIPFKVVETLCNKDKFRSFLMENGFNAPLTFGYSDKESALSDIDKFNLPIIIKPVDSSGSKGITVLHSLKEFEEAIDFAFSFSRSKRIVIEEFIEKKHKYLIGGDIFVYNREVILWGLLNCHRDNRVNPLVPVGKSYPLHIDEKDIKLVKETLQKMIEKLDIINAMMNVELVIDKNDRVWLIDVGPRNGGNMIPDFLSIIFGVDVTRLSVEIAMGEKISLKTFDGTNYYATHNLHSNKDGIFKTISFSPEIESHIIKKEIYKKEGDKIEYFDNASKAIGIIFMKFDSEEQMFNLLSNIEESVFIEYK